MSLCYYWLIVFHVSVIIFGQFSGSGVGREAQPQLVLFAIWLSEVVSKTSVMAIVGNFTIFLKGDTNKLWTLK